MNKELHHGGDWVGFAETQGCLPLDFSANISPLGVPTGVQTAIAKAARTADRYPDPLCRTLRQALSESEGTTPSQILCGNGAADLIFRAVLAVRPRRALVTAPAFSEYEAALAVTSCAVERWLLREEDDFRVEGGILEAITPELDMLFLCEPNNPTGITTERSLLQQILTRCSETGTRLILDECFCPFLDDPAAHSLQSQMAEHPCLLILRAFTKLYGLAGVRLGYALCADEPLLEAMWRCGQPWAVSSLAQAAGLAALRETEYANRVRMLTAQERPRLFSGLQALGLRVIPGEGNYLLFQSETPLMEPLYQQGILLRSCANYAGLDETWYRTAVRSRKDNERLLAALKEIC